MLWTIPIMCKPGLQDFFIIYKFDPNRIVKAIYRSKIPIRLDSVAYHHVLPKMKRQETEEEKEARRDKNYYFDIFKSYHRKIRPEALTKCL